MLQFFALVTAIWLFKRYLINKNWRTTQYYSALFTAFLGLQWLFVFHNTGGLQNGWFTLFINVNQVRRHCLSRTHVPLVPLVCSCTLLARSKLT